MWVLVAADTVKTEAVVSIATKLEVLVENIERPVVERLKAALAVSEHPLFEELHVEQLWQLLILGPSSSQTESLIFLLLKDPLNQRQEVLRVQEDVVLIVVSVPLVDHPVALALGHAVSVAEVHFPLDFLIQNQRAMAVRLR